MSEFAPTPQQTLALLLGASSFRRYPTLAQGKPFYNSAQDFKEYLVDSQGLSLPEDNVNSLFDDTRSPSDQLHDIGDFIERRTATLKTQGIPPTDLIVYYAGHGFFSGQDQAYSLAVRFTDQQNEGVTSLRVSDLASVIKACARFLRKFLILDCCFSAAAYKEFQTGPLAASRVKLLHEFPERGTSMLCSASSQDASLVPAGLSRTMFSDALINALRHGHASLGPRLSVSELGDLVKVNLVETYSDTWVRPEVHSPDQREGDIASVPLFPNVAYLKCTAQQDSQMADTANTKDQTDLRVSERQRAQNEGAPKSRSNVESQAKQHGLAGEPIAEESRSRRQGSTSNWSERSKLILLGLGIFLIVFAVILWVVRTSGKHLTGQQASPEGGSESVYQRRGQPENEQPSGKTSSKPAPEPHAGVTSRQKAKSLVSSIPATNVSTLPPKSANQPSVPPTLQVLSSFRIYIMSAEECVVQWKPEESVLSEATLTSHGVDAKALKSAIGVIAAVILKRKPSDVSVLPRAQEKTDDVMPGPRYRLSHLGVNDTRYDTFHITVSETGVDVSLFKVGNYATRIEPDRIGIDWQTFEGAVGTALINLYGHRYKVEFGDVDIKAYSSGEWSFWIPYILREDSNFPKSEP